MKPFIRLFFIFITIIPFLTSCYKKDLDELNAINSVRLSPDIALPLFYTTLTIKDSLPFELPEFNLADTAKIDLTPSSFLEDTYNNSISSVELKLITENTFPIKGNVQIYFVDKSNNILDSLFSTTVSYTPPYDDTNKTTSTTLIMLDREKYSKIEDAEKVYIRYTFNSTNYPITEENYLTIKSGIKISFSVTEKW